MAGERVLVLSWMLRPGSVHERYLQEHGLTVDFQARQNGVLSEDEVVALVPGAAATIASVEPYTPRVYTAADALKIVARVGVGFDAIDVAAATAHGVAVTTTPGTNEKAVADFAFGLILTLGRAIPANAAHVQAGRWERVVGPDIDGAILGIVGTGLIGKEVARRGRGFGMRLLAYDVAPDARFAAEIELEYRPLAEVAAAADFLTVHVPLMPATRHLIGAAVLAGMKPTAYLVNTSRGGTVDEVALHQALVNGQIAGAGLDVFETEPPWGSPLLSLPNVIATPHVAGISQGSREAMLRMACRSVVQRLRGKLPEGLVNKDVV